MTDTPRTDAILTTEDGARIVPHGRWFPQLADLCRELEREVERQKVCISEESSKRQAWAPAITAALDEFNAPHDTGDIEECVRGIRALGVYAEECRRAGKWALDLVTDWVAMGRFDMADYEKAKATLEKLGHEIGQRKCPIGLDATPEICSAVGCDSPVCARKGSHAVGNPQEAGFRAVTQAERYVGLFDPSEPVSDIAHVLDHEGREMCTVYQDGSLAIAQRIADGLNRESSQVSKQEPTT